MGLDPNGVEHEITFWRRFVTEPRFQAWIDPTRPCPELRQRVVDALAELTLMASTMENRALEVLDVGSGPVSILRGIAHESVMEITTCDPLSSLYQEVFDFQAHGIKPPLPLAAEELEFHPKMYDVVHISNALDHTYDPLAAAEALFNRVKPGGQLIIQGFVDEATFENYQGFHQFNLHIRDRVLLVQNKLGEEFPVLCALDDLKILAAETTTLDTGRNWFVWAVEKSL